jgi:alkylation response protein AidB-like acyl-CoA dehydrogenase
MDFEFSADQELLRETVRRFVSEQAPISYVREHFDDDRGTSAAVWEGLADLGVTGLLAPEAQGGAGMGMVDVAVVAEELGRGVHPGPFTSSAVAAISAISLAGDEREQAYLLPELVSGDTIGTLALLEPNERFAWQTPTTTAAAGDAGWTVSGTKIVVPDGLAADLILVTARVVGEDGVALFGIKTDASGITRTAEETLDGTRHTATVVLDDAPGWRIGSGDATAAISETLDRWTTALVVDGVGAATKALEISVEYAKERQQFDQPIGAFQAVQHLCADMLREIELARAASYFASWACDAAPAGERARAVAMAQAFAADGLYRVGANAVQVHGGIGFTWEADVHLYYKRLLSLQVWMGGAGPHLDQLADLVI